MRILKRNDKYASQETIGRITRLVLPSGECQYPPASRSLLVVQKVRCLNGLAMQHRQKPVFQHSHTSLWDRYPSSM